MTNYPYYKAVTYNAGVLTKICFGVRDGKKFKSWDDCARAIRCRYKKFPQTMNQQILILEYTDQYESKIIDICCGNEWTFISYPIKLM